VSTITGTDETESGAARVFVFGPPQSIPMGDLKAGAKVGADWPALLRAYETAVAEFEAISRALTSTLTGRNPLDHDLNGLLESEEKAREAVVLARQRIMEQWRRSDADLGLD
jgi:hypothetical protein